MLLEIVKYGDPRLREQGRPVRQFDRELKRLVDDMLHTMHDRHGAGLAAQQVGYPWMVAVIDPRDSERPERRHAADEADPPIRLPLVLVNPELDAPEGEETGDEGCLSFPDLYLPVRRAACLHVRARDVNGTAFEFQARGFLARAIQHEVDHLHGVLFIDRLDALQRIRLFPRLRRMEHESRAMIGVG